MNKILNFIKKTWLWFISATFLLAAFGLLPHISGLLCLVAGIGFLPINKWQDLIKEIVPEKIKKVKTIALIIVAVLGIVLSPTTETENQDAGASTQNKQQVVESTTDVSEVGTGEAKQEIIKETTVTEETPVVTPSPTIKPTEAPTASPKPTETPAPTPTPTPTPLPSPTPTPAPTPEIVENSYFEVHFIDVGQADAALVICDDKYMLIDGGNAEDSSIIYTYLKNLEAKHLDYVVATHAHEDHVGGLAGALNYATAGTVYCPVTDHDTETFKDFKKYVEKVGIAITIPNVGDTFNLGSAKVEIVGVNGGNDVNDTSIVLKVTYGETNFLFTGDAEREAEQTIINAGYDISSTVLKVGHHGSADSTTYPFLREIMPSVAIISVGSGNSYGHPTEDVLSRLRDADVKVYRTDLQGDIVVTSDGKNVEVAVEKNPNADTLAPQATPTPKPTPKPTGNPSTGGTETKGNFAVNNKNGKIHIVGECSATGTGKNAMKEPVYFDTFEAAEAHSIKVAPSEPKRKCGNCYK